jgi:hypothetical protein
MKKGGNLKCPNIFLHDIIKSIYEKVEYNKKLGQICQTYQKIRILGFSLQNGFKLMKN